MALYELKQLTISVSTRTMHSCQPVGTCLVQCFLASGHHEYIFKLLTVPYCRLQQSMPHRLTYGNSYSAQRCYSMLFIHSKTDVFTDKVVMAVFLFLLSMWMDPSY